jgi:glyoxylase-like metal-dependent hydrolase (beta-lactamase superfamily II)
MIEIAPGVRMIDTQLGGRSGLTSAYLIEGSQPALVDPGPETSAGLLIGELHKQGIGPDDLAWIVLTHIHLDHCGATGAVAAAFPRARVIVHERGARHIAEPARLVAASHEVYAATAPLYGGLTATAADRIVVALDGHRVPVGDADHLEMIASPGHARHHMSVLHPASGLLMIGDAAGSQLPGGGLYPNVPPSDVDISAGRDSLKRLSARRPTVITVSHFGPTPDPIHTLADADDALDRLGRAAMEGYRAGGRSGIAAAVDRYIPIAQAIGNPEVLAQWQWLSWDENNILGLEIWAQRQMAEQATR